MNRSYVIKKTKNKIIQYLVNAVAVDHDNDYNNTVLLAGTGRSGTTWMSNVINYDNEYRYMFEPFNTRKVKDLRDRFCYLQYLRPEEAGLAYYNLTEKVLTGELSNLWINSYNKKVITKKRLIKDIRANLILHYIYHHFPGIPIVLMIRHPCAVAQSKMKLNWETHLNLFLKQDKLMEDHLNPFKDFIEHILNTGTKFEKHITMWCIENYVPLKQFNEGEIHVVFYENFLSQPEYEVSRLFQYIGKRMDDRVYSTFRKPSQVTKKKSSVLTNEKLIHSWRQKAGADQMEKAEKILEVFGLNHLYPANSVGDYEKLFQLK